MTRPTLDEQIAEVGREIGLRRNVYQRLVGQRKMTPEQAALHLARMEAAYETLIKVRDEQK